MSYALKILAVIYLVCRLKCWTATTSMRSSSMNVFHVVWKI